MATIATQENLDLWRFGPQGWTLMAAGLSGGTCAYEWDTNDVGEGWYFFRMSGASGSGQGGLAGSNSGWLQLRAPPPPYTAAGTPTVAPLPPAWQAAGKGREFVGMEGMQGIKEDLLPSSSSSSSSFSSSLASPVSLLIFASQARQAALLPAVEWPAAGSDPEGTFDLDALRRFGPVLDLL